MRFAFPLALLLMAVVAVWAEESAEAEGGEGGQKGKKMVDRLAMNLAGAFMNSLFPAVDKAKKHMAEKKKEETPEAEAPPPPPQREIRRSPVQSSYPQGLNVPFNQYSAQQVAMNYNAIPQDPNHNPQDPLEMQQNPRPMYLATQQHLPAEYQYKGQQDFDFPSQRTSAASQGYNAAPQGLSENPRNPFEGISGRRRAPAMSSIAQQTSGDGNMLEALMPKPAALLAGTSSNPGRVESINAARNQQYMAELAKHQQELSQYSQKQMEYLDQQRRYQQSMIDHQAGAALLMQQQQQQLLEEQINRAKQMQANPFAVDGGEAGVNNVPDNTVGGRLLTQNNEGDDVRRRSMGFKREYTDDDMVVTDESLKGYFKTQYGIDIPDDGTRLTDDERETLVQLKKELQAKKSEAINDGTFKMMNKLKRTVMEAKNEPEVFRSSPTFPHPFAENGLSEQRKAEAEGHFECPPCIPVKLSEIKGTWTQIYGNPAALKKTFSTIMSLEEMDVGDSTSSKTLALSNKKPSCIGMEISGGNKESARLNVYFKDDGPRQSLHEMKGEIFRQDDDSFLLSTDMYNSQVCVVKAGPSEVSKLEYIVLADTIGARPCSALHVFARNVDEFQNRFYDDFAEFIKMKLKEKSALPVAKLPEADQCQLE